MKLFLIIWVLGRSFYILIEDLHFIGRENDASISMNIFFSVYPGLGFSRNVNLARSHSVDVLL